ncbi:hypothetical protein Tco_0862773 [Tanacetum coccineum]
MAYFVDGVLASGVEIILEMDFVRYAIQELEIHSFMIQIRILSVILQTFSTIFHSPRHTRVSYVGTILTMVMIVHHRPLCQPRNQNFYEPNLCYNSNSSGFDQPPQYSIDHQPQSIQEDLNQQRMNDVHNEWINNDMIESRNELLKTMQSLGEMLREQAANLSTHTPEPSRRGFISISIAMMTWRELFL